MTKRTETEKAVAVLTLRGASQMTSWERWRVASWLRNQASFLEKDMTKYSGQFRARYLAFSKGRTV